MDDETELEDLNRFVQISGGSTSGVYALTKEGFVWWYDWDDSQWVPLGNKRRDY